MTLAHTRLPDQPGRTVFTTELHLGSLPLVEVDPPLTGPAPPPELLQVHHVPGQELEGEGEVAHPRPVQVVEEPHRAVGQARQQTGGRQPGDVLTAALAGVDVEVVAHGSEGRVIKRRSRPSHDAPVASLPLEPLRAFGLVEESPGVERILEVDPGVLAAALDLQVLVRLVTTVVSEVTEHVRGDTGPGVLAVILTRQTGILWLRFGALEQLHLVHGHRCVPVPTGENLEAERELVVVSAHSDHHVGPDPVRQQVEVQQVEGGDHAQDGVGEGGEDHEVVAARHEDPEGEGAVCAGGGVDRPGHSDTAARHDGPEEEEMSLRPVGPVQLRSVGNFLLQEVGDGGDLPTSARGVGHSVGPATVRGGPALGAGLEVGEVRACGLVCHVGVGTVHVEVAELR